MTNSSFIRDTKYIKQLLALSPFGAYLSDLQGNYLYLNKELESIYGRSMNDILGMKWLGIIYNDDLPMIQSALKTAVDTRVGSRGLIYRINHPRKGVRYCKVDSKFIFDENGKALYYIGYVSDMTAEVHKTENIKLQNELLSALKNIQDQFYLSYKPETIFSELLNEVMRITNSKYGFISEVMHNENGDPPIFKNLASSDIQWHNDDDYFEQEKTMFTDTPSHFSKLLKTGNPFIVNGFSKDGGHNHTISSYIVLPAKIQGKLVGMIGLANRHEGYRAVTVAFLSPLLTTFANLIAFYRLNTEKEIAVNKQQNLTEHLQTLITSLEDIIFELDGNKTFKHVWVSNDSILFMPKENFIGKTVSEVFGQAAPLFSEPIDKALKTGEVIEFEYKHIDTTIDNWYKAKITTVRADPNQANYRLVLTVQDITTRKKQAQALEETKGRLERSIFLLDVTQELAKVAGWEYFIKTKEFFLTKQAFSLYDVDKDFIPTLENTKAFFEMDAKVKLDIYGLKAIKERAPYKLELPLVTAKNRKKWVRAIGVPIINNNEVIGLRGATLDITEEKEAELTLLRLKEQLETSNKDKDRIMQVLAHDLRSPLSAIHTMAAMMLEKKGFTDRTREIFELIRDSSLSSHNLVADLIDAMINNSNEDIKLNTEDIVSLVNNCVKIQRFRANEKQQQINLLNEDPIFISMDSQKIKRVINNLISNAIKFSPTNSAITISMSSSDKELLLSIEDKGIGIPPELQSNIFDVLTTVKRYGTAGEPPFGIGLSICKQIIEAHKGKISVKSELDKGSTFFITLPVLQEGN